ncbi:hypothetical protein A2U01_0018540 [Trifolium medium]|uniref:Uncharacterized protein n=1 Tax=Trifolium medium TaxID=97028 RepID=A0A392NEH7_9FABA|nr:hypothetical protein [Trifolium medium]
MSRCDVARVKILTGVSKFVDSSMAVTVRGVCFDIRVVEDLAGWNEGECCCGRRRGGDDDNSSRASFDDGGGSVVAAVEGISKTGSDADVSETCQVLLEVEKRGVGRNEAEGDLCVSKYNVESVSEYTPNILGNPGKVVGELVNFDVDLKEGTSLVESARAEKVLGIEMVGSLSNTSKGTTCEEGFTEGRADVENQRAVEEESLRNMGLRVEDVGGPAHDVVGERACYSDEGGCEIERRVTPQILRTRNGDLSLCGPNNSGPPILLP